MALVRGIRIAWSLAIAGALVTAVSMSGCGKLQGLSNNAAPLVTFNFTVTGDTAPFRPAGIGSDRALQVALVWGEQWLTEPFCILPAENPDAAMVITQGCRDPFRVRRRARRRRRAGDVGMPTSISPLDLPSADLMVGDITSRVAYASLVLYDDRDGDGTLDLALSHRLPSAGPGPPQDDTPDSTDIVYGASFLTMTSPDQRIGYLEGMYTSSAFYPRNGCEDPSAGFSILSAGGFAYADGIASIAAGTLPPEDPATCANAKPTNGMIDFTVQGPATAEEAGCMERVDDSSTRYRQPPFDNAPDFTDRVTACAHLPSFDAGDEPNLIQLVVSGRPTDRCKGLTHYTLRGCRNNVACTVPQWDYTANPPPWWPCPQ